MMITSEGRLLGAGWRAGRLLGEGGNALRVLGAPVVGDWDGSLRSSSLRIRSR
jgi:hypothetical protein